MKLLVTGGCGFIGSNFVRHALEARPDLEVTILDLLTYAGNLENLADRLDDPRLRFVKGDIADPETVAAAAQGVDAVVNFAAETHVDRSILDAAPFVRTNVAGTQTLLDACRDLAVPRFLQVSTDEVYGSLGRDGHFCEDTPYRPNSPYSASKAAGDHLANAWFVTYGLPVLVSNCSNNYGRFQHPEKLVPTVLRHALAGSAIPVYGDGSNCRDWLNVEDHVEGLLRLRERGRPGEKYLFGARADVANLALVKMLCGILDRLRPRPDGTSYAAQISFVDDRPGHDFRYAIDPAKAERALGWSPRRALPDGLAETVAWYLDHPSWLVRPEAELMRLGLARSAGDAR